MTEAEKIDVRRELIEWDTAYRLGLKAPLLLPYPERGQRLAQRAYRARQSLESLGIDATARADGKAGGVIVERLAPRVG